VGFRFRLLTPPGPGAIALFEVEGPAAEEFLSAAFAGRLPRPGRVGVSELRDAQGQPVDEVVLARDPCGDRFTLSSHGGLGVVAAIREVLGRAGALEGASPQAAEGRRCEAEAEALLPLARTDLACQVLLLQLQGSLRAALEALIAEPEPRALSRLLLTSQLGRRLTQPARVALWGAPNAGKSSLLNALLGRERVLVAEVPGTTRDAVEVELSLAGVPVSLVDTAGQRSGAGALEAEGIALARAEGAEADLRLVVVDGSGGEAPPAAPEPNLVVWNKRDLAGWKNPPAGALALSAATGEGISELRAALRSALLGPAAALPLASGSLSQVSSGDPAGAVLFTPRQAGLVAGALGALEGGDPGRARRCLEAILG
jgi:tRNA modification GTPase